MVRQLPYPFGPVRALRDAGVFGIGMAVVTLLSAACTANPPPPVARVTTTTPRPAATPQARNTVVVAIDHIGPGFNPHLLADQSPVDGAVSSMVLPSPFRPVPDTAHPGATLWVPDRSVLTSAAVTSQNPFTITYRLRDDAQWSDGAPIAAEDFHYLWQQMITQPGVVDPAGYHIIADVGSSGGGKVVTVTMKQPYPAWPQLFSGLLPSHLIKDAPGGFEHALQKGLSISGAQFHIKYVDPERDEILLERNDRFWDRPAKPDQILMRRGGTSDQLADSLRTNDAQLAQVHAGDATRVQLAAIPSVRTAMVMQPRELQFTLNGRFGPLVDARVRGAILALLDPQLLAVVGQGTENPMNPARALVLAPSDPGYAPTGPPRLSPSKAYAVLAAAGYVRSAPAAPNAPARLLAGGKPLTLRIGVAENDPKAAAVANSAADQLRIAGIDATVAAMPADDMYGPALVGGGSVNVVDAVVGWVAVGGDHATALASRFGCPPAVAAPAPTGTTTPNMPSPTSTSAAATADDADPAARAPSNVSGVCNPSVQPQIDAAVTGRADVTKTIADVEPKLWNLATTLPIMQDSTVVAAGPEIVGASLTGAIEAGPFADAGGWSRVG